ncbi:MAG: tRNA pseudouridine(38-40) synthase TruA, partial [Clostridiales bacterium]|nr:tRNA pseudouridine(38-40) synthase TruA [Clostridiales bacterium]
MRNIRLTVEYDGTNYHGWQSQINAITVQDKLEEAISGLTGETISVTGSSRTDYGVHALGQVVNFFTGSAIPADKFSYALNSRLPYDIVIKSSEEVPLQFHSRYSATGKKYIYKIYNSTFPSALLRNRAFHVSRPLDVMKMKAAAEHLLGRHDFSTFMSTGSSVKTTVRTISKVSLELEDGLIILGIEGDGFLYNMVRIIAGTLVEIGFGKINAEDMPGIIAGLDRKKAGRTAPPQGLY